MVDTGVAPMRYSLAQQGDFRSGIPERARCIERSRRLDRSYGGCDMRNFAVHTGFALRPLWTCRQRLAAGAPTRERAAAAKRRWPVL